MRYVMTLAVLLALCSTAHAATRSGDVASSIDALAYGAKMPVVQTEEDEGEGPSEESSSWLTQGSDEEGEGPSEDAGS